MPDQVLEKIKHIVAEDLDLNLAYNAIDETIPLFEGGLALDSVILVELISFIEPLKGTSPARRFCPTINSVTSMTKCSGISSGRHSISISRVMTSSRPPWILTPLGSPVEPLEKMMVASSSRPAFFSHPSTRSNQPVGKSHAMKNAASFSITLRELTTSSVPPSPSIILKIPINGHCTGRSSMP